MTIRLAVDGTIKLEGSCDLEDAEKLQQYLMENPRATVDWRSCDMAHTAVIQVLMVAKPVLQGPPAGAFLRDHLDGLLKTLTV